MVHTSRFKFLPNERLSIYQQYLDFSALSHSKPARSLNGPELLDTRIYTHRFDHMGVSPMWCLLHYSLAGQSSVSSIGLRSGPQRSTSSPVNILALSDTSPLKGVNLAPFDSHVLPVALLPVSQVFLTWGALSHGVSEEGHHSKCLACCTLSQALL